jgi:exosome complex RNA-binding protein Rrp42 (RNase PH superfamily)
MLAQLEPPLESAADSTLLLRGLLSGRRRDGRGAPAARALTFSFTRSDGRASAEVVLGGSTRVHAAVTADLATPHPDKPLEGFLAFHVEVLPSASRAADFPAGGARAPFSAVHVSRVLERQLRDARAIDTEALCVVPGERVWALRCDVRVVEDGGNAADAASAAALAALLHFRRPDVTLRGRGVMIPPSGGNGSWALRRASGAGQDAGVDGPWSAPRLPAAA